jgi:hypothetical protein
MHLTGVLFWLAIDHDRSLQLTSPDKGVGQTGAASRKLPCPRTTVPVPCPCARRAASRNEPGTPKHQTQHKLQHPITPPPLQLLTMRLQQSNCANLENTFHTAQLPLSLVLIALHCCEDTEAVRQARKLSKPSNKSSTHNKRRNSYGILKTSQRERCLLQGR